MTFTAPITPAGRLLLQPIVSATFAHASLGPEGQWVTNGPQAALRGAAFTVFAEYGVAEDLAFGAQIEARLAERLGAASEGVGETQLFVRRTILRERGWCPEATVLGLLKLPTGNAVGRAALLGTDVRGSGTPDLTAGLDVTHGLAPVLAHADLLITQPVASDLGPQLAWAVSAEWPFWPDRLGAMLELSGKHQLAGGVANGHADEVIMGVGLEVLLSADLQILAGYQRTLWGRNVGGFDTVVLTVVPMFL